MLSATLSGTYCDPESWHINWINNTALLGLDHVRMRWERVLVSEVWMVSQTLLYVENSLVGQRLQYVRSSLSNIVTFYRQGRACKWIVCDSLTGLAHVIVRKQCFECTYLMGKIFSRRTGLERSSYRFCLNLVISCFCHIMNQSPSISGHLPEAVYLMRSIWRCICWNTVCFSCPQAIFSWCESRTVWAPLPGPSSQLAVLLQVQHPGLCPARRRRWADGEWSPIQCHHAGIWLALATWCCDRRLPRLQTEFGAMKRSWHARTMLLHVDGMLRLEKTSMRTRSDTLLTCRTGGIWKNACQS